MLQRVVNVWGSVFLKKKIISSFFLLVDWLVSQLPLKQVYVTQDHLKLSIPRPYPSKNVAYSCIPPFPQF